MTIRYSEPLFQGFSRMKKSLFQPFDLSRWISIGFTAFLAGLTESIGGVGGSSNGSDQKFSNINNLDLTEFFSFPELAQDWLIEHPLWVGLIILALVLIFVLTIVLTWVSSLGKFMFLYNVVNNSDAVVKPWHDFRKHGNSLFWWQLIYGAIVLVVFILLAVYGFGIAKNIHTGVLPDITKISFIIGFGVTTLGMLITFGYISIFLNDFIIPIMYKLNCPATHAWSKFFTLLLMNAGSFVLYGILIMALGIALIIAIVITTLATCYFGFILLIIPFVGSVILLPVSYTYRAFSIEFLAQFGQEYDVFSDAKEI